MSELARQRRQPREHIAELVQLLVARSPCEPRGQALRLPPRATRPSAGTPRVRSRSPYVRTISSWNASISIACGSSRSRSDPGLHSACVALRCRNGDAHRGPRRRLTVRHVDGGRDRFTWDVRTAGRADRTSRDSGGTLRRLARERPRRQSHEPDLTGHQVRAGRANGPVPRGPAGPGERRDG